MTRCLLNFESLTSLQNKSLSGDYDRILQLQGISWFKRQAIKYATITLYVKHYRDDAGFEHIDIDQTITGGIPGTREERLLDWTERHRVDDLFGAVAGKSRRVSPADLDQVAVFLKTGWTEDTFQHGLVQSYVESDTPKSGTTWIGDQTWGIEDVNGERRYVRHVKFTGPEREDIEQRLIYDYLGPL